MKTVVILILVVFFLSACEQTVSISNFEECVAAGFPIMESFPRQCAVPNQETFVSQSDVDEIKKRSKT